jgi:hypothetical protein
VDVPVIDNRLCERWHKSNGINVIIYDEMMCAGYRGGGKDSCQVRHHIPYLFLPSASSRCDNKLSRFCSNLPSITENLVESHTPFIHFIAIVSISSITEMCGFSFS